MEILACLSKSGLEISLSIKGIFRDREKRFMSRKWGVVSGNRKLDPCFFYNPIVFHLISTVEAPSKGALATQGRLILFIEVILR